MTLGTYVLKRKRERKADMEELRGRLYLGWPHVIVGLKKTIGRMLRVTAGEDKY